MKNLKGSVVALATPFNEDESIDYDSLEKLVEFHIENKTDGILLCGTTGETPTLNENEYKELLKFGVEKINGRVSVVAGVGTNSTEKTKHNCKIARECGVDALLVVGPYYNKPTPKGFYLHFSEIAKSAELPIIVYNVPGRTGKNIPTDVLLKLANEFENIIGVKEASGDINQMMDIINRRPEEFRIYSGDDSLAFALTCLGGDGCISVVANEIPAEFHKMLKSIFEGEVEKAREIHYKYLNLMNLNFIETNPIPVKTALSMMGKCQEVFRLPMCKLEDKSKETLKKELSKLEMI